VKINDILLQILDFIANQKLLF